LPLDVTATLQTCEHVVHCLASHVALTGQINRAAPFGPWIQKHAKLGESHIKAVAVERGEQARHDHLVRQSQ
jgi:hypothetical protein